MAATRWMPTQIYDGSGNIISSFGGGGAGQGGSITDATSTTTISVAAANLAALNTVVVSTTAIAVLAVGDGRSSWEITIGTAATAMPSGMTLNFAASYDGGATYHPTSGTQLSSATMVTGGVANTTTSANNVSAEQNMQVWFGFAATATHIAVWCSAVSSGSVAVRINASVSTRHVVIQGPSLVVPPPIVTSAVSITRPNNATAYSARQIINHATSSDAPLAFTSATRIAGGNGLILGARMVYKRNVASPGSFVLYLFTSAPVNTNNSATGPNDAQVLGLTSADNDALIPGAVINFSSSVITDNTASPSGALLYTASFSPIGFALPSGTTIYGLMVNAAALTPVALDVFTVQLTIAQS